MEFKKYSSLENSDRIAYLNKCEMNLPRGLDTLCQVTEKIHGANFSFYIDQDEIKTAKRTSFCGDDFFSCGEVVERLCDQLSAAFHYTQSVINDEITNIIVYGELAGNGIQKEVQYGDKDFYVYDIKANGVYLTTEQVYHLCNLFSLKHAPVLEPAMTLRSALAYDEEFKSLVLDVEGDNFAEGIVIKPIEPAYLPSGERIAIKKKGERFSENAGTKFKEAKAVKELSLMDQIVCNNLCCYLNKNRLSNVLSKEEKITQKEFGRVMGLLMQDAIEDYIKDNHEGYKLKDICEDHKLVSKKAMGIATLVVRENWLNILDGEF